MQIIKFHWMTLFSMRTLNVTFSAMDDDFLLHARKKWNPFSSIRTIVGLVEIKKIWLYDILFVHRIRHFSLFIVKSFSDDFGFYCWDKIHYNEKLYDKLVNYGGKLWAFVNALWNFSLGHLWEIALRLGIMKIFME
jgi:hypothetical protein